MRGNSDRDSLYPLSAVPAAGYGNRVEGDTRAVIAFVPRLGAYVKVLDVEAGTYEIVNAVAEATVYADAAEAAIAAADLKEKYAARTGITEEVGAVG